MSNEEYVYWVAPTCNAGTAAASFTTTAVNLSLVYLWRAEIRIPPGHAGLTGIALVDSNTFVIPYSAQAPAWLIGDDDELDYNYGKELGKNVKLATYNTGSFNHGWQVRLVYTPMSALNIDDAAIEVISASQG